MVQKLMIYLKSRMHINRKYRVMKTIKDKIFIKNFYHLIEYLKTYRLNFYSSQFILDKFISKFLNEMLSPMKRKIPIIVYLPSKYVIKLSVLPNTKFCDLFRSIPSKDINYVYNGSILCNNQTFNSAGIKAGDSLVLVFKKNNNKHTFIYSSDQNGNENSFKIIKKNNNEGINKKYGYMTNFETESIYNDDDSEDEEVQKWIRLTQDTETFNEKMRMIVNQDNARETARLKDILLAKIERKPRYFRKLCLAVKENHNIFGVPSSRLNYFEQNRNQNSSLVIDYTSNNEPSTEPLPIFFPKTGADELCSLEKNGDTIFSETDSISPALKP